MNPTAKIVVSTTIALLSTYLTSVTTDPAHPSGFSVPAALTAVVAALNAVGNLYTKKPNQE